VDSDSGPAGMVHTFIICSGAAFAAAYSTGIAELVIHVHHVGVERLECSESTVGAVCQGLVVEYCS
jgi:hypothetical protein